MHTLLALSSLLLTVGGGALLLGLLRGLPEWPHRRELQLIVLAAPTASLGIGIGGLHHFAGRTCFVGTPPWDYVLGLAFPLVMAVLALGGTAFGMVRLLFMHLVVVRRSRPAPTLQTLADRLADRLGTGRPRVLLYPSRRPLAITSGLRRPTVLISSWMVEHLDGEELESVLAHEVAHIARRDYVVIFLATVLRDAFLYLPTSREAYRQLQHEKELACDDLAVAVTQRPLALASALARVFQQVLEGPPLSSGLALADAKPLVAGRIERLLASPPSRTDRPPTRRVGFGISLPAVVGLLVSEAAMVAVLLTPMGCGLRFPLG